MNSFHITHTKTHTTYPSHHTHLRPHTYRWKGAGLSTASETRFSGFTGDCFRCGGHGHWADDGKCPWLEKAASPREHRDRIRAITMRFLENPTPEWRARKSEYIRKEVELWKAKAA